MKPLAYGLTRWTPATPGEHRPAQTLLLRLCWHPGAPEKDIHIHLHCPAYVGEYPPVEPIDRGLMAGAWVSDRDFLTADQIAYGEDWEPLPDPAGRTARAYAAYESLLQT